MDIQAPENIANEGQSNLIKRSVWEKFYHFLKRKTRGKRREKRQEQLSSGLLKFGERKSQCIMKRKMR